MSLYNPASPPEHASRNRQRDGGVTDTSDAGIGSFVFAVPSGINLAAQDGFDPNKVGAAALLSLLARLTCAATALRPTNSVLGLSCVAPLADRSSILRG